MLSVGALTAIWATATGIRLLRRALQTAYGVPEAHPVWKRIVFSLLGVPVFTLAGIAAIGLLVVTSRTLMRGAGLMVLDVAMVAVWDRVRVPAAVMLLMGLLSAVYRVGAGDRPPSLDCCRVRRWPQGCGRWSPWRSRSPSPPSCTTV